MGDRLLRAVERWFLPWYSRAQAERETRLTAERLKVEDEKAVHTEEIRRDAIAARVDAEQVRKSYALVAGRLRR